MAQFSLSLINNRGTTVLTDYDTMVGKTAGLTFDEHLNLNVDGSTLDFSMLKYLYEGSKKVVNTPTISITYGSIIKCLHNGYRYDFAVTDISYQFLPQNLQLTFSAQDYFQFETSKLGIGYTITGDTTDPDYFGAQPIDAWAQKIVRDNNLRWNYIPINQANREWINLSLTTAQKNATFNVNFNEDGSEYWNQAESEYTLNQWVSFECSDSTAYNALKQLASENGLMIAVDYSAQNFWFIPQQNIVFNGYYFNPNNNLQQFSLKGSAQNLVTVLNVTGPKDLNNQEITLVPKFPVDVVQWILSNEWADTKYYPGLYNVHTEDATFLREIQYAPWLENKLIDFSFFTDNNLLMSVEAQTIQDILYNKLRIINANLIIEQNDYLAHYGDDYQNSTQKIIDCEALNASLYSDVEQICSLAYTDKPVCFAVKDEDDNSCVYWPLNYTLYGLLEGETRPIEVTAESLAEGHPFYNKLYSPDIGLQVWTDTNIDFNNFSSISLVKDGSSENWPLFQLNGNLLQYQGYAVTSGGWRLEFSTGSLTLDTEFEIHIPDWCLELQLGLGSNGPGHDLRISYADNKVYASVCVDGSWSNQKAINTNSTNKWDGFGYLWYSSNDNKRQIHCRLLNFLVTSKTMIIRRMKDDLSFNYVDNDNTICKFQPLLTSNQMSFIYKDKSNRTLEITVGGIVTTIKSNQSSATIYPPTQHGWSDMRVRYQTQAPAGTIIRHIQVLVPLTLYATNNTYTTNSLKFTIKDDVLIGDYEFNQLRNAIKYTGDVKNSNSSPKTSTIIVDQLNELCGMRDSYAQTLAKNCSSLLKLWNYSSSTFTIGSAAIQFQDVAMMANGIDDEIVNGSQYAEDSQETFTTAQCAWLRSVLSVESGKPLLRSAVVGYVHEITTNITEYWNNCYNAAMGLGIYWPKDWNNSKWLCLYPGLARTETELLNLISPLVPKNWNRYTKTDLVPNLTLMPCSVTRTESSSSLVGKILGNGGGVSVQLQLQWKIFKTYSITFDLVPGQSVDWKIFPSELFPITCEITYQNDSNNIVISAGSQLFNVGTLQATLRSNLEPILQPYVTYQFRDHNEVVYHNIQFLTYDNLTTSLVGDNTQLRLVLIDRPNNQDFSNSYLATYYYHNQIYDNLDLYSTCHSLKQNYYDVHLEDTQIPADILSLPFVNTESFSARNPLANPCLYNLYYLATQALYNTSKYYTVLHDHDEIWRGLYQDYPGIFRESTYVNDTATSSQELYVAAKAQLDSLSKPSYEYSLTGMDIYMHDSDYVPTRLKLGEQIRIDYQDPDQITDTLNAAIREPLYVTGISHALRNDGDYQFTVTTRAATDTMVQRFAQLLSFGR